MARRSLDVMDLRRQQVEALELRGQTARAIAKALAVDARTVRADIRWLVIERARRMEIAPARLRLLDAGQAVEREAWQLYHHLPAADTNGKLGALGKILAAQAQQLCLLGAIEAATLAGEITELRAQVAALAAARGGVHLVAQGRG